MKIVIIEDEVRIREGLARLIQKLSGSYEIVGEAQNGKEGLLLVKQVCPDIIITDIKMPEMDGLEMLTRLFQEGIKAKAIVLSAYSEFEYARGAMRLGVKEYLLKPLVVGDISEALHRVTEEIKGEKRHGEEAFSSLEQIFSGLLWGKLKADKEMGERIHANFSIPADTLYEAVCLYLGDAYEEERSKAVLELQRLFSRKDGQEFLLLEADREKALVVLTYGTKDEKELEKWVKYRLVQDRSRKLTGTVGFLASSNLEELPSALEALFRHMDWNISLGDDVMISYPKITRLQTYPCIYPLEMENQMKLMVCAGRIQGIKENLDRFHAYFRQGSLYAPREIKECHVRFLWALMNTGKEVGILDYEGLEQQKLLERIMGARTCKELKEACGLLTQRLVQEEEQITHLTVKRAQSLIQEFYQTGITLEEIAGKLNITPEYLGTRFHKEMGVTFSAYMKNFRITKAKELLIGTSLKLYEIAEKVGYSDPKYFSRVFREMTGQLPADYRKTHK